MNIATDVAILNHDIMAVMINNIEEFQKCNIRPGANDRQQCYSLVVVPLFCMM